MTLQPMARGAGNGGGDQEANGGVEGLVERAGAQGRQDAAHTWPRQTNQLHAPCSL
jgi:hypothetical protein